MYYSHNTTVFLNGRFIKASEATHSLYTQTLHYGNGVFEGIRSYDTAAGAKIFKAREHFERFHFSANVMHIALDYSVDALTDICYDLLERNNLRNAYIRPLVFTEGNMGLTISGTPQLFIAAWQWEKYLG